MLKTATVNPLSSPASCPKPKRRAAEIKPPGPGEHIPRPPSRTWLAADTFALALFAAMVLAWLWHALFRDVGHPIDKAAVKVLVERIITVESGGDANAKNKRSSATGAAQFIDETWLEAVRKHRRDLLLGRSDKDVLELRRDAELSRQIATRQVEQYAAMLSRRGLPVTPGALYLAHFAGPAGAVALLSGAESADAATLMAAADASGRTTREKLVSANPFLKVLSVGELKKWADGKMRGT